MTVSRACRTALFVGQACLISSAAAAQIELEVENRSRSRMSLWSTSVELPERRLLRFRWKYTGRQPSNIASAEWQVVLPGLTRDKYSVAAFGPAGKPLGPDRYVYFEIDLRQTPHYLPVPELSDPAFAGTFFVHVRAGSQSSPKVRLTLKRPPIERSTETSLPDFHCQAEGGLYYFPPYPPDTVLSQVKKSENEYPFVLSDGMHFYAVFATVWLHNRGTKEGTIRRWTTTITLNGVKVRTISHDGKDPRRVVPEYRVRADFQPFKVNDFFPPFFLKYGINTIHVSATIAPLQGEANFANNSCSAAFRIERKK